MPIYSLTVNIDHQWAKRWSEQNAQVCLAFGTGIGGETYTNVVACTSEVAPHVKFVWTDDYMIAGSDDEVLHGVQFGASSDMIPAQKGSLTTLTLDWDITSTPSNSAPRDGFIFKAERNAAAVLYRQIDGHFRPVYISNGGKLAAGSQETIVPKDNVAVWITNNATGNTFVAQWDSNKAQIDMTGKTDATATLGPDGSWKST